MKKFPRIFRGRFVAPKASIDSQAADIRLDRRQALTPGLLAAAAAALLRPALQQQPGAAVALLEGLAQVARFDLNLLSVPRRQREELAADWDAAAAELGGDAGQAAVAEMLASLRQKYKL